MPWSETCPMIERKKFIECWRAKEMPVSRLATAFGISRKTAYKWIDRFWEQGLPGLADGVSVARTQPHQTSKEIEERIIATRRRKPFWGPKKLLWLLKREQPGLKWPAHSTIGEILKRNNLIALKRTRSKAPPALSPFLKAVNPNDVWSADFKGWIRTSDGRRVDPLTITDNATRFLLKCQGLKRPRYQEVRPVFEEVFREFGLPKAIRVDNGPPFASVGIGGLSHLSVWWIRLGIRPERIRPGKPQENGRHERMHRTLKQATAKPPKADFESQQAAFDDFQQEFNEVRPHEALGMLPPGHQYRPSGRGFPDTLSEVEYGTGYHVRRVRSSGEINWKGRLRFISLPLIGENIGFLPLADGIWAIDYADYRLGFYHARTDRIVREPTSLMAS